MLVNDLKDYGLSKAEAKVYLAALELGQASISRLAKKSGIKRTSTYLVVDSLKEKGLFSSTKKGNKTLFLAEDPRKIEEMLEEKKEKLSRIMPELLAFSNIFDRKPKIRLFEGKDAFKEAYKDTLNFPKSEVLAWFSEDYARVVDSKYFLEYYIPKRLENRIWVRAIFPNTPSMRNFSGKDKSHLRQSKIISTPKFKLDIEIMLYGKYKIGLISYDEEITIIIESSKIFKALESLFEVMWEMKD